MSLRPYFMTHQQSMSEVTVAGTCTTWDRRPLLLGAPSPFPAPLVNDHGRGTEADPLLSLAWLPHCPQVPRRSRAYKVPDGDPESKLSSLTLQKRTYNPDSCGIASPE